MANAFEISKIEAARRQLDTALKLYFQNQDSISIHTLASAAQNILQDLSKKKGFSSFFVDRFKEVVREDKWEYVRKKFVEPENFFKHADKDHDKSLKFNPQSTDFIFFDCCSMYPQLCGELTDYMQCFNMWFGVQYNEAYLNEKVAPILKELSGHNMTRSEFLDSFLKARSLLLNK